MEAGLLGWLAATLVFGSTLFWLALIVLSVIICICDDQDSPFFGTLTVLATLILFKISGLFSLSNPILVLLAFLAFVVCGVVWSVFKWGFFLSNKKDHLNEIKLKYIKEVNGNTEDDNDKIEENTSVKLSKRMANGLHDELSMAGYFRNFNANRRSVIPTAVKNKRRIMGWVMYWPWSVVWTIINDPVRKFFKMLWRKLSGQYQKMADTVFKDVVDDTANY